MVPSVDMVTNIEIMISTGSSSTDYAKPYEFSFLVPGLFL